MHQSLYKDPVYLLSILNTCMCASVCAILLNGVSIKTIWFVQRVQADE